MKRTLTLLLTLLFVGCFSLSAKQSSYSVYEFRGDVLCKKAGTKQWTPVARNMQLGILDSISVSEGGYVRLRDSFGDDVYRSVSAGKMRVMDLVITARKQSRQRVELQVNDNIKRNMKEEQPSVNVYGMSTRSMDEVGEEVIEMEDEKTPDPEKEPLSQDTVVTIRVSKDQLKEFLEVGCFSLTE